MIADKKPPENKVFTERIVDFSGGLNTTINGSLLNSNEAQVSKNVSYSQKGTLAARRGRKKRYATQFSASPVSGLARYYKKDGTTYLITASGASLYYDTPSLSRKWTSQEDFEATGTSKSVFLETGINADAIIFKRNLVTGTGNCESVLLWTFVDLDGELYPTWYKTASNSIKATIATGKTVGYMTTPVSGLNTAVALSAYVKNGNATDGIRLVALNSGGTVVKASSYQTATTEAQLLVKLTSAEAATVVSVGIEVKGTAAQYAYVDAVVLNMITAFDVTDGAYVAPEYAALELADRVSTYLSNKTADIGTSHATLLYTEEDFTQVTNVNLTVRGEQDVIVNTGVEWSDYSSQTFDQMIAL